MNSVINPLFDGPNNLKVSFSSAGGKALKLVRRKADFQY